jgi:hypothetical protein
VPDRQLTSRERAILFALLAEARPVSNVDLRVSAGGLTVDRKERDNLLDRKLIEADTTRPPYVYELSDTGWRWCADEMATGTPPRGNSLINALYLVLRRVRAHLDRTDHSLADVFGAAGPAQAADAAPVGTRQRIRSAYAGLAAGASDWVRLADLLDSLADVPTDEIHQELRAMERDPAVHIAPDPDQLALTDRDRAAAVRIGGKAKHLIAIDDD